MGSVPVRQLDGAVALAWRLRQHGLCPQIDDPAADVVRRVIAIRAWPADAAELSVEVRQSRPDSDGDGVARALDAHRLVRSYAFRGGSYVLGPRDAATLLTVRTITRVWESTRYQRQGGFEVADWEALRDAIREVLTDGPQTRTEIGARLARYRSLGDLTRGARGTGSDALYKPLHWWGDICFGPSRGTESTFQLVPPALRWVPPDPDDAGRDAVRRYLHSYGPATLANLEYWLSEGLSVPKKRLHSWLTGLAAEITQVEVSGQTRMALTADVEPLFATRPSEEVALLPGFDAWILGAGTADTLLLDPKRRPVATRGANLVIHGGKVVGSWRLRSGALAVECFEEAGVLPVDTLAPLACGVGAAVEEIRVDVT